MFRFPKDEVVISEIRLFKLVPILNRLSVHSTDNQTDVVQLAVDIILVRSINRPLVFTYSDVITLYEQTLTRVYNFL